MLASQGLAMLGGLVVLLPVMLTELPSHLGVQSLVRGDERPHSIAEADRRQIVVANRSPYSAIGKFNGTMTCTGAIVLNPRIVITAGHCITERDGTIRRSGLSFQPGYQLGTDLGRFQATVWAIGSKQSFTHESVGGASRDWAILVLDHAPAGVRPLLLNHRSSGASELLGQQIILPAYSNDIANAEVLSVDPACTVRLLVWDALIHTCRAQPGSSGAPLLLRDGSDYAVVGIHTASMFASDEDGHVAEFIGNQAIASSKFADAVVALSRQLDGAPVQSANSAEY